MAGFERDSDGYLGFDEPKVETSTVSDVGKRTRVARRYGGTGGQPLGRLSRVARRYGTSVQRKKQADGSRDDGGAASRAASGAMPAAVQAKMEWSFAADFSEVRVHEGAEASAMGAQAFTQGTDIHFASGTYAPETAEGQQLLGHELAHVVQQSQGRVSSSAQAKSATEGVAVNEDAGLEREADDMGARAARGEAASVASSGAAPSGTVVQMKREPISPAGMGLLRMAETSFRTFGRSSLKQSRKAAAAKALTEAANKLDVTGERNANFVQLARILAAGLHEREVPLIRQGIAEKIAALTGEVADELVRKGEAETLETAEGGHALGRHGPAVSDAALIRRLHSGMAPDNKLSPAPGASSRFNSYADVLETRQAAAAALQTALTAAAAHVLTWLASVPGLTAAHTLAQNQSAGAASALAAATIRKNQGFAQNTPDKLTRLTDFQQAGRDKQAATANEATAKDEMDNPGKNLKRVMPGMTAVKLEIADDAGPGELEDGVKLVGSYSIVVDHGKPIGSGFSGDDSDLIRLTDVLAAVAVDPGADPLVPQARGDILTALGGLGVGGDLAEFAAYLDDAANLATVKQKASKGAKIYPTVTSAGDLTKSFTNFKRGGTGAIFDDTDTPVAIDCAGWDAIQHFPAANSAADGIQG